MVEKQTSSVLRSVGESCEADVLCSIETTPRTKLRSSGNTRVLEPPKPPISTSGVSGAEELETTDWFATSRCTSLLIAAAEIH